MDYAAQLRHWKTVELLADRGADVNPRAPLGDKYGLTPLMRCAVSGPAHLLGLLIRHGARANAQGYHDITALMLAAVAGRPENVKVLLQHGASVNTRTYFGRETALDLVAEGRDFIDGEALSTPLDDATQRHHWVTVGRWEMMEMLVKSGADVNPAVASADPSWQTPLMRCAADGPARLARLLIRHGAKVSAQAYDGLTALMLAAGGGHAANVGILLQNRADANMRTYSAKRRALDFAIEGGHYRVARLLRTYTRGRTPTGLAVATGGATE